MLEFAQVQMEQLPLLESPAGTCCNNKEIRRKTLFFISGCTGRITRFNWCAISGSAVKCSVRIAVVPHPRRAPRPVSDDADDGVAKAEPWYSRTLSSKKAALGAAPFHRSLILRKT